jgi:hypothetical protein
MWEKREKKLDHTKSSIISYENHILGLSKWDLGRISKERK